MIYTLLACGAFALDLLGNMLQRQARRQRWPPCGGARPEQPGGRPAPQRQRAIAGAAVTVRAALTLLEIVGSAWLLALLLAQTFGWYQTCFCNANMWVAWGGDNGYVSFGDDDYYQRNFTIRPYWVAGTVLGCAPLLVVLYAVAQWCGQSFLWSVEYAKAMRGLRRIRRARRLFNTAGWRRVLE
jgi:hypothetical protein